MSAYQSPSHSSHACVPIAVAFLARNAEVIQPLAGELLGRDLLGRALSIVSRERRSGHHRVQGEARLTLEGEPAAMAHAIAHWIGVEDGARWRMHGPESGRCGHGTRSSCALLE